MATAAHFRITDVLPLFDRRSALIYGLIASCALLSVALILFGRWSVDLPWIVDKPLWVAVAVFVAAMLRRAGRLRVATFIETTVLLLVQGVVALFVLLLLIPISGPMADTFLARADAAVGFHWPDLANAVAAHPSIARVLAKVYSSFDWQGPVVLGLLAWTSQVDRAWRFVTAALVTLLISTPIFLIFPAANASVHFAAQVPLVEGAAQWREGAAILAIKAGRRIIDLSDFVGIMSMPSFHAGAALLFTWAGWRTSLRWPLLFLNAAMCFAAIPIGSHYFVDIIAGIIVASLAILLSKNR